MPNKKPTYYELLKHPLWQKKRLEILDRAEFHCESCESSEETLHVHHSYYERGLKPWEYPAESLHALCADCHQQEQDKLTLLHQQIGQIELSDVEALYGFALGLQALWFPHVPLNVYSHDVADGVARAWDGVTADEIMSAAQEGVVDGYKLQAIFDAFAEREVRVLRDRKTETD